MFSSQTSMAMGPLSFVVSLTKKGNPRKLHGIGLADRLSDEPGFLCPQNGDYIFIFRQNAEEIAGLQQKFDNDALEAWETNRQNELFDPAFDTISPDAQRILEMDKDRLFYDLGFMRKNKSNFPSNFSEDMMKPARTLPRPVLADPILLRRNEARDDEAPRWMILQTAVKISQARDEIIYQGFVDLDDEEYEVGLFEGVAFKHIKFRGLQKGLDEDAWAEILHAGHQTLLIRPAYGLA